MEHHHKIGMVQQGSGPHLALEALFCLSRLEPFRQDHLDRHHAVESVLPGLVNHSHTTTVQLFEHVVAGDDIFGIFQGLGLGKGTGARGFGLLVAGRNG